MTEGRRDTEHEGEAQSGRGLEKGASLASGLDEAGSVEPNATPRIRACVPWQKNFVSESSLFKGKHSQSIACVPRKKMRAAA